MRKTFLFVAVLFAIPFVAEAKLRQNIEAAVASNFPLPFIINLWTPLTMSSIKVRCEDLWS